MKNIFLKKKYFLIFAIIPHRLVDFLLFRTSERRWESNGFVSLPCPTFHRRNFPLRSFRFFGFFWWWGGGGFEKTSTAYEIVGTSGRFSGLFWPLNRFNMSTSAQVSSRENLKFIHGVRKIGGKAWIFSKKSNIWGFFRRHLGLFWREILYRAWWYSRMYVLWGFENATDWSPGREIKPCVLWAIRVALRPG